MAASIGPSTYIVVVMPVRGTDQPKPQTLAMFYNANLEHLNIVFLPVLFCVIKNPSMRLFEEHILALTIDDLAMLSGVDVRVPFIYFPLASINSTANMYSTSVLVPYVNANLRPPTKVEQAVIAQSTVQPKGSYVVPATTSIMG
jgi:hypothetical protein